MFSEWLRRCEFRTESSQSLDDAIADHGGHLLQGDADVFTALSSYLLDNMNLSITTQSVRDFIRNESPFTLRPAALDDTLGETIEAANRRYLESYSPFGFGGQHVSRSQASEVQSALRSDPTSLVLLTGEAGSGKSGIVRQVMAGLEAEAMPCLAFRIDRHLYADTRAQIGSRVLERDESPVSALATLAEGGPAVLIVDQIDAISEISGRTGAIKDVLLDLVRETQHYGDVRCLLVCRSFDLETIPNTGC